MIILIGGESHTGKTLMAQNLLEKYHYSCTSIDHIKMGMIRGYEHCGFTALDSDEVISQKLWPMLKGMIDTCLENDQNMILEGCYLPPDQVCKYNRDDVVSVFILFSRLYIENSFDQIISYESVIEKRNYPEERSKEEFTAENTALKEKCIAAGVPYFEIHTNYAREIQEVYDFIHQQIMKADGIYK